MKNIDVHSVCSGLKSNYVNLKKYNEKLYKLTWIKGATRVKGFDWGEDDFTRKKGEVNEEKQENNISRSRGKVFGYAMCNPWEYFCTFTIDKTKFGRYDLNTYHKALAKWIQNYNKKFGIHIKYLLVPEKHKDGAWHEHGFIIGLPLSHLRLFTLDEKLPKYIRDKLKDGQKVYDWSAYRGKFGWVDFEPIRSQEASAKYVQKYMVKELAQSVTKLNAHLYYCSKGLKEPQIVKQGTPVGTGIPVNWENDYVGITWIKDGDISKLDYSIHWDWQDDKIVEAEKKQQEEWGKLFRAQLESNY